jgi:pimeloyl-ACP methyl ester carboxylesterase
MKNQFARSWVSVFVLFFSLNCLAVEAIRETATTQDGLHLGIKHYPNPGAQPILMIHGMGTNDREWDANFQDVPGFGKYLHAKGYDVWIGNLRGVGTEGFRSEAPSDGWGWRTGWSIDDYSAYDLPAMVEQIYKKTGQSIWLMGHSLGVKAIEGYLAGLHYDESGKLLSRPNITAMDNHVRGLVLIAGVHNLWWPKKYADAQTDPVLTEEDYYKSNYELEFLAGFSPLYYILPTSGFLPMGAFSTLAGWSFESVPFVGSYLKGLYRGILYGIIGNPLMNIFYHTSNMDEETLRTFAIDGVESVPFKVIEQLANTIQNHKSLSYYHLSEPSDAYDYAQIRSSIHVPTLVISGGHDRMTHQRAVYEDGFQKFGSMDKTYINVDESGHFDLMIGKNAVEKLMIPIEHWLQAHR